MFIAQALIDDGQLLLVLGLSRENLKRLQEGRPIDISRQSHGLAVPDQLHIVIFFGETEASIAESMKDLIGPTTVMDQKKPQ